MPADLAAVARGIRKVRNVLALIYAGRHRNGVIAHIVRNVRSGKTGRRETASSKRWIGSSHPCECSTAFVTMRAMADSSSYDMTVNEAVPSGAGT